MMKRLFKGGTVVSGEGLKKIDLLVKGEKILVKRNWLINSLG